MESNNILFLLLDTIDMSQALSIGVFLILLNKKKKNSLLYLGAFLFITGLSSITSILEFFNDNISNTYFKNLPFNFIWLIPSLLYVYVEKTSILKKKKHTNLLLAPGIIEFFINLNIYFLPIEKKLEINESIVYDFFEIFGVFYGLILIILIFRRINKHSKLLKNQYSSLENRELKWISRLIILLLFMYIAATFMAVFVSEFVEELVISIFGLFITYWVSYNGLLQQVSKNLIIDNINVEKKDTPKSEINLEKYKDVLSKVKRLLNDEQLFLNQELAITHIAEKVNEHPRLISTAINQISGENFNSYINSYRVEKAKSILLSSKANQFNIEGIGYESGFKSNSSFYAAFKKSQKITPLQFIKNAGLN